MYSCECWVSTGSVVARLCSRDALVRDNARILIPPRIPVLDIRRKSVSNPPKHDYHAAHYLPLIRTSPHRFLVLQIPKNYQCRPPFPRIGIWTLHDPHRTPLTPPSDHPSALPLLQAPPNPPERPIRIHGSALRFRCYQPDCWMPGAAFHHSHRGRRPPCLCRLRPCTPSQHRSRCAIIHVLGSRRHQGRIRTP